MTKQELLEVKVELGEIRKAREIGYKGTRKFVWQACINCGKRRWVMLKKGKPVSLRCLSCNVKLQPHFHGSENPHWKGGRYKTGDGYILVKLPPDSFFYPMANHHGYVRQHRLVVAEALNRCLLPWEIVHHKNGVKDDNRYPENLQLLPTRKYHLVDTVAKSEIAKLKKEVLLLKERVTLLEAENIVLRKQGIKE